MNYRWIDVVSSEIYLLKETEPKIVQLKVFLQWNLMKIVDQVLNWIISNCQISFLYQTEKEISTDTINLTLSKTSIHSDSVEQNSNLRLKKCRHLTVFNLSMLFSLVCEEDKLCFIA
jgi:hypothetical protein